MHLARQDDQTRYKPERTRQEGGELRPHSSVKVRPHTKQALKICALFFISYGFSFLYCISPTASNFLSFPRVMVSYAYLSHN